MMDLDVKMREKRGGKKSCSMNTIEMVVLFLKKKKSK